MTALKLILLVFNVMLTMVSIIPVQHVLIQLIFQEGLAFLITAKIGIFLQFLVNKQLFVMNVMRDSLSSTTLVLNVQVSKTKTLKIGQTVPDAQLIAMGSQKIVIHVFRAP
jgi:hypothetical protein